MHGSVALKHSMSTQSNSAKEVASFEITTGTILSLSKEISKSLWPSLWSTMLCTILSTRKRPSCNIHCVRNILRKHFLLNIAIMPQHLTWTSRSETWTWPVSTQVLRQSLFLSTSGERSQSQPLRLRAHNNALSSTHRLKFSQLCTTITSMTSIISP